jgi:quercetin dioxygenase-like cupin family protein
MRVRPAVLALSIAVVLAAVAAAYALGASSTPVRTDLAGVKNPAGAKGQTLSLFQVTIPAGAQLAKHHHPGTQVAHVQEGTLTYKVFSGDVPVYQGSADANPRLVRNIRSGQTATIKAGQWLVETKDDVHSAANNGSKRILIYLSTLLKNGEPPSIPVQ